MRFKVYIIDEAHMISGPGANAFLKTLEEPPPYAVFILATTEPQKLPITILSRCQRYSFKRIAVPVMIDRMRVIAKAEGISINDEALAAIAYRADGGLRDALTMLEQAAAFSDGSVDGATLERAFGASGREFAHALVDAAVARDAAGALRAVEEASDAGTDMGVLIRAVIAEFRNLLVARVDPALLARDLAPEDAARAAQSAGDVPQATIVRALRLLSDSAALARSSGNPRLELESALLRFILAADDPTLDGLAARVAALEGGAPVAPVRAPAKAAPRPEVKTSARAAEPDAPKSSEPVYTGLSADDFEGGVATNVEFAAIEPAPVVSALIPGESPTLQKVKAAWQSVRTKVESERQPLRMPLARAVLDSLDGNVLTVKLPVMFVEILKPHTALLEGAIAEVLGASLTVRLAAEVASKPAANPRGKGDAPAPLPPSTDDDNPDALFNYANERIK